MIAGPLRSRRRATVEPGNAEIQRGRACRAGPLRGGTPPKPTGPQTASHENRLASRSLTTCCSACIDAVYEPLTYRVEFGARPGHLSRHGP
jgi:hypothetical protein